MGSKKTTKMKIIEEPTFQLSNSVGFDALLEREMEALEGGECTQQVCFCTPICNCFFISGKTSTTTSTTSTTTQAALPL